MKPLNLAISSLTFILLLLSCAPEAEENMILPPLYDDPPGCDVGELQAIRKSGVEFAAERVLGILTFPWQGDTFAYVNGSDNREGYFCRCQTADGAVVNYIFDYEMKLMSRSGPFDTSLNCHYDNGQLSSIDVDDGISLVTFEVTLDHLGNIIMLNSAEEGQTYTYEYQENIINPYYRTASLIENPIGKIPPLMTPNVMTRCTFVDIVVDINTLIFEAEYDRDEFNRPTTYRFTRRYEGLDEVGGNENEFVYGPCR